MPIVARTSRPSTLPQRVRLLTEGLLMQSAQRAMLRAYPSTGASPYRKEGPARSLFRFLFLLGFRLTPWRLRRGLMSRFLVKRNPPWPVDRRRSRP
ncbi:MAG TPA: hypothetical protein VMK12_28565 [Anaeromyxobacteraceae bacterium]|nr:hypothetical protein [Anaeromyxobacteraceae bacterium]